MQVTAYLQRDSIEAYNQNALRLEQRLSEIVPLLKWEVMRIGDGQPIDFLHYDIRALMVANGVEVWASYQLPVRDYDFYGSDKKFLDGLAFCIVNNLMHEIVKWKR